jgi:hypothetical protein
MFNHECDRVVAESDVDRHRARNRGIGCEWPKPTEQLRLKICAFTLCFFRWSLSSIG